MKAILLVGLGRFGKHIAMKLHDMKHEVLAVDSDEEKVNEVLPFVTHARIGDCTNKNFLSSLGIDTFDVCIVTIGDDFQSSLETTSLLKELGAKKVISRASRGVQEKFLLRNGADEVVYPEKQLAAWTAIKAASDHIFDYIELDKEYSIYEVSIPKAWAGRTVGEVDVKRKHKILIMAIKINGNLNMDITFETKFNADDRLLVLGKYKDVQKCFKI